MRANLTFNLDNEDDKARFEAIAADEGGKLKTAMHEFSQQTLRKYRKYGIPKDEFNFVGMEPEEIAHTMVEHVEKKFYEALDEFSARIDD